MSDDLVKAINRLAAAIERQNQLAAQQSVPERDECPRCQGRGQWAPGVLCGTCGGSG